MKRFAHRIAHALKAVLRNRWLWLTAAIALTGWFTIRQLTPEVTAVPAIPPGSPTVTIAGARLGRGGQVVWRAAEGQTQALAVAHWSPEQIIAQLPGESAGGAVQVKRTLFASDFTPVVWQAAGLPSQPFDYANPVAPDAPWPTFRRDLVNNGRSPLPALYHNDQPWFFQTEKGIFSTPVIDEQGIIYVGSADHNFYALHPDGREKWRFTTGEIIDSAAAIPRPGLLGDEPGILVPSGNGHIYHLNRDDGRLIWSFNAPDKAFNSWFEGNVQIGYDGTIYAGNTNFNYYAITPEGTLKWTFPTGSNAWSVAGIGEDGTIFWGSNDTFVYAVTPDGQQKWAKRTLGFIAASAAIGSDGTVYISSFDSHLYALDPVTGDTLWRFRTGDHIYSSAALSVDEQGQTTAVYIGSADGSLYALDPAGSLLWSYDTGDVIRSSPVLGRAPDGVGEIVYFGAGNGRFYALNAADGTRRWSFDTTDPDPERRDRNDLNASPALGQTGVYFAGEHGQVWYVPYDYCLHASSDARCQTNPGSDLPADVAALFYVSPGGNAQDVFPDTLPTATMITLRLLVREADQTVDAWVCNNPLYCPADALTITLSPETPFAWEKSADGRYLYIRPEGFLQPATAYTLTVSGHYYTGGLALGNLQLGGRQSGSFADTFTFQTTAQSGALPLAIGDDEVQALEWTRLAVPIPPMMPSLNQIGFDYMDWIMTPVVITPPDAQGQGRFVLWVTGGKTNDAGQLVADPESDFLLPFSGRYQGQDVILQNKSVVMEVTGIPIPFNLLEMRGRLGDDFTMDTATLYADTDALSIPNFGPYLVIGGLANDVYKKLLVSGTFITRPYPDGDPANKRPSDITVTNLTFTPPDDRRDGQVVATLQLPPGYDLTPHRPAILLLDSAATEAVYLNYLELLATAVTGDTATITLTIPAGTALPAALQGAVLFDAYPLALETLSP
ncbi:MAG: PQQ-binding-like beta-propeller repeat protein [Chloroflexi bacterium]|nr:PQQ-binding-like beta-propeller repeat protein [Chloroflexota bacterium]